MSRIANYHVANRSIYTDNLSFLSHCFKNCIKTFDDSILNGKERDCSKFCLEKHIEAGVLLGNMSSKLRSKQREGFYLLEKRMKEESGTVGEDQEPVQEE